MSPSDNLLRFDARNLDDRPPLRDFGFLHRGERLGRLLLARRNDKALVNKVLTHGGIVRCANGGGVELIDDVPRRALGGDRPATARTGTRGTPLPPPTGFTQGRARARRSSLSEGTAQTITSCGSHRFEPPPPGGHDRCLDRRRSAPEVLKPIRSDLGGAPPPPSPF